MEETQNLQALLESDSKMELAAMNAALRDINDEYGTDAEPFTDEASLLHFLLLLCGVPVTLLPDDHSNPFTTRRFRA